MPLSAKLAVKLYQSAVNMPITQKLTISERREAVRFNWSNVKKEQCL
jgi:hypothetical protein